MLKFYPSRFGLLTDALVGLLALTVVGALAAWAIPRVNPYVIAAVLGPLAVGFFGLVLRSIIWLAWRLPTLEASEELFTLRRRWGQKILVRWTEVTDIEQVVVQTGRRPRDVALTLRFVTNSGRFEGPLDVPQARLARPLAEILGSLVDRTMARYVLTVQREPPAEWRQKTGSSGLAALFAAIVLLAATVGACWYAGVFG